MNTKNNGIELAKAFFAEQKAREAHKRAKDRLNSLRGSQGGCTQTFANGDAIIQIGLEAYQALDCPMPEGGDAEPRLVTWESDSKQCLRGILSYPKKYAGNVDGKNVWVYAESEAFTVGPIPAKPTVETPVEINSGAVAA